MTELYTSLIMSTKDKDARPTPYTKFNNRRKQNLGEVDSEKAGAVFKFVKIDHKLEGKP